MSIAPASRPTAGRDIDKGNVPNAQLPRAATITSVKAAINAIIPVQFARSVFTCVDTIAATPPQKTTAKHSLSAIGEGGLLYDSNVGTQQARTAGTSRAGLTFGWLDGFIDGCICLEDYKGF